MKILLVLAVVCVAFSFAAEFQERPNPKADAGKCLSSSFPDLGQLKYGESKDVPKKCTKINCHGDGRITGETCGSVFVPPGHVLSEYDYSKPYSDCCPGIIPKP